MISGAVGFGRAFPRIWLLPIVTLTVILGLAVFGQLSRSIVADLFAWWPVWLGIGTAAYLLRETKVGPVRVAGLIPLVAAAVVVTFGVGHVAGWTLMPSASQRLVGPVVSGATLVRLDAVLDGSLELGVGSSEFAYEVEPVRRGGPIGVPGASEITTGSELSVVLEPVGDPGVYTYAGWKLSLSPEPVWGLVLSGAMEVDLRGLVLSSLSAAGSGLVWLGEPSGTPEVVVEGQVDVVVPRGAEVRVTGLASVPASWSLTTTGARAPAGGDGWQITILPDATVRVTEG